MNKQSRCRPKTNPSSNLYGCSSSLIDSICPDSLFTWRGSRLSSSALILMGSILVEFGIGFEDDHAKIGKDDFRFRTFESIERIDTVLDICRKAIC